MEMGADDAVASAQAAVAGLSDKYIGWVNDDLKRLDAAISRLVQAENAATLRAVYDVAHDIKGQGSTFGYGLVTEIAHRLCRYVDAAAQRRKVDRTVIDAHVTALRTVVDNRIQGDAGELGAEILRALEEAAQKSLS
jgi:chemotaxis protein histidine kinase CheA